MFQIKARPGAFVNRRCVAGLRPWRLVLRLLGREPEQKQGCCGVAALQGQAGGTRPLGQRWPAGKEDDTLRSLLDDDEYWHNRAEEAWAIGEICTDAEAQRIIFEIADKNERLAKRAAEREAHARRRG